MEEEKLFILQAAKDLCYPKSVIKRIEDSNNPKEWARAMATARNTNN